MSRGGDTVTTPVFNLPSEGFSGWMNYSHTFTASSASEPLSFLAQGSPAVPPFALLDNVSPDPANPVNPTPEPSTMVLALTGLVAVGLVRRFRRSASA